MTSQDSSVQLVDQAVLLFTLGEEKEAESLLVEYLSRHENDLSAWRALSEIRLSTKDFSAAEHACR